MKSLRLNNSIAIIALIFLPFRMVQADYPLPDSLLILLEETTLEAGESWIDLWEMLSSINAVDISTQRKTHKERDTTAISTSLSTLTLSQKPFSHRGRFRLKDPSLPYPGSLLRVQSSIGSWHAGGLVQRDPEEPDLTDLWRIHLIREYDHSRLLAGDFRIDAGMGWCLRSTPSFPAGYYAVTPRRLPPDGFRANVSTEEGCGWRGLAGDGEFGSWKTSLWGGYAQYDARIENGDLLLYSEQGLHDDSRLASKRIITERHAGGRVSHQFKQGNSIGATAWKSIWDKDFAPQNQPARFRGGSDGSGALGLDLSIPIAHLFSSRTEIVRQENGGWGGAALGTFRPDNWQFLIYGYRADQSFHSLHSRPFLPFSGDPSGRTGLYGGVETAIELWQVGGWWALENHEAFDTLGAESFTSGGRIYGRGPITDQLRLDLRAQFRQDEEETSTVRRRGFRCQVERELERRKQGLRSEFTWEGAGRGGLLSLYFRESTNGGLTLSGSIAFIQQYGSGAWVTLIEPYGPGQFPVRRAKREGIHAALYSAKLFRYGLSSWVRMGIKREFDTGDTGWNPSDATEITWMLGIEWRARQTG